MIELRGDRVLLRGFRPDEFDLAMERMQSIPPSELDRETRRERRERIERSGERGGWEIMLAIEAGGRLVGDVQGRCPRLAMPPGVWELGIELWEVADRGRGVGTQTVALFSSYLFEHEDAIRVQAEEEVEVQEQADPDPSETQRDRRSALDRAGPEERPELSLPGHDAADCGLRREHRAGPDPGASQSEPQDPVLGPATDAAPALLRADRRIRRPRAPASCPAVEAGLRRA